LGPIAFVLVNLVLLAIGRHPLQNPYEIKPTVGKMARTDVERITLVMYIPAPNDTGAATGGKADGKAGGGITEPPTAYAYPPVIQGQDASKKPKRRFRFALLRRSRKSKSKSGVAGSSSDDEDEDAPPTTWEGNWVAGALPFVRLEANRATCAICLMDFAEPVRAKGSRLPPVVGDVAQGDASVVEDAGGAGGTGGAGAGGSGSGAGGMAGGSGGGSGGEEATHHQVQGEVDMSEDQLRLADAGETAQPLRLLACGHAFHVSQVTLSVNPSGSRS
jgi:hypothetical protein